jgi:flagellar motor switch protein FliG
MAAARAWKFMSSPARAITGLHKAAILLVALGDSASADLLKHLTEDEVQKIMEAIAQLESVPEEQSAAVLDEFRTCLADPALRRGGGVGFAKRVLTAAFGPEASQRHLDRLPQDSGGSQSTRRLRNLDPVLLARFVETEHPQTVALVLAHLDPVQSAAVVRSMNPERGAEVTLRLARLDQVAPAVMAKISAVISNKLKKFGALKKESAGGLRTVAEIFNQLDPELSTDILSRLTELDSGLVEAIRQKMFVFEDLLSLDTAGVKEMVGRSDRRVLALALKGAGDDLRKHLLQGMSQRGSAMLLEDMEALGPVKIKDVDEAQQLIISVVRQMESEGVVNLKGGGGDEQYIV